MMIAKPLMVTALLAMIPTFPLARPVHPAVRQLGAGLLGDLVSPPADVLDPITASLGLNLDLDIGQTLICNTVNGTFGGRDYNLGCTCLDLTGSLLLEVDVDAITNVDGLQSWIAAQVSDTVRSVVCLLTHETGQHRPHFLLSRRGSAHL